ncbi:MAG: hypothetical protein IPK60_19415 [Sandaracinaceae bacterium]|nr:hypothetical protein [Sandaracinaceae bacterium]
MRKARIFATIFRSFVTFRRIEFRRDAEKTADLYRTLYNTLVEPGVDAES